MRNLENKEKIVQVSGILKITACLAMALYAFLGIGNLFSALISQGLSLPNPLMKTLLWSTFPSNVIAFIVWWNFWQLFRRLNDGHIFDGPTVTRLATAGKWKLAGWIYSLFSLTSLQLLLSEQTDGHKPGLKFVSIFLVQIFNVGSLINAVAIIFAAWLLHEGQTLEEDQKLTV